MIEPYDEVIEDLANQFARVGFSKIEESDDAVIFGDGTRSIDISTELRNPAQIILAVTDVHGSKRALWILENLLDWDGTQSKVSQARAFWTRHAFDKTPVARLLADGSLSEFVRSNLLCVADFVSKHYNDIFDPSEDTRQRYLEASNRPLRKSKRIATQRRPLPDLIAGR